MFRWLRTLVFVGCGLASPLSLGEPIPELVKSAIPPPKLSAKTWVLMDYNSGWVLADKQSQQRIEPASLSKLMTAYVIFHEIKKGALRLDDLVHISEKAWRTEGSRMFVRVNSKVRVDELLQGLIIQSGNDAAVALAEHVAGTEEGFAALMNEYAKRLALRNTSFKNAAGLPQPDHYSSVLDLVEIAAAIIREFPEYYSWYSTKEFTYNKIKQQNRNLLLWRDDTVDGVKTGHTSSAGYCLIGSAKRGDMRLIAAVTGAASAEQRARQVHALLKYGFSTYESTRIFDQETPTAQIRVFKGDKDRLPLGVGKPVFATIPRGKAQTLKATLRIPELAVAPIAAGQSLGSAQVEYGENPFMEVPLVALSDVAEGSWWKRALDAVLLWFE